MCKTIEYVDCRLCCSCGLCEGVCSFKAISFEKNEQDFYIPKINHNLCKNCGLCYDICPGDKIKDRQIYESMHQQLPEDLINGNVVECFNAKVIDEELREKSTSGGMVTGIISYLLSKGEYEVAFCVNTYDYSSQVKTVPITCDSDLIKTLQSRYVTVSHSDFARFILENNSKKVIVVAVGCAMTGIRYIIEKFQLNPSNYLCLGLFCACSYSYRTWDYFQLYNGKKPLNELQFRLKNGKRYAYGMIKATYGNDSKIMHTIHRAYIKSDFAMERCLYCTDLLNVYSDISFGDNNTKSKDGESCTVIIRTRIGENLIRKIEKENIFIREDISVDDIKDAKKRGRRELFANIYECVEHGIHIYLDRANKDETQWRPLIKEYYKQIERKQWALNRKNLKKLWLINQLKYYKLAFFNKKYLDEVRNVER